MTDVFFSYSSKDRNLVRPAHDMMQNAGFEVFWDVLVQTADDWERLIKLRLEQAKVVVVFWTKNSATSDNVKYEVRIARDMGKLVQVMLEPVPALELPMGADSEQASNLTNWNADANNAEWTKLVRAIEYRATPPWMRRKFNELELSIRTEQARRLEADQKVLALEAALQREVEAQGEIRRERDRSIADAQRLRAELKTTTALIENANADRNEKLNTIKALNERAILLQAEQQRLVGELRSEQENRIQAEKLVHASQKPRPKMRPGASSGFGLRLLRAIPALYAVVILYNIIIVFGAPERTHHLVPDIILLQIVRFPTFAGVVQFSLGDLFIFLTVVALAVEVWKATHYSSVSLLDHGLAAFVFMLCLIEFVAVRAASTSIFLFILIVASMNVYARYAIGVRIARRELSIGSDYN